MYSSGSGALDGVGLAFPKCYAKEMDQKARSRWKRKDNAIRDARVKVHSKLVWQPMGMKTVKSVDNGILMLDMVNPSKHQVHDGYDEYDPSMDESLDGQVSANFVVNLETKRRLSVFAQLIGLEGFDRKAQKITGKEAGDQNSTASLTNGDEEKKEDSQTPRARDSTSLKKIMIVEPDLPGEAPTNIKDNVDLDSIKSDISDFSEEKVRP